MSEALDAIFMQAPFRRWPDGAVIFQAGERPTALYRILRGRVLLQRNLEDGTEITFQDARAGKVIAEASVYAPHYHCSARAVGTTDAQALPLAAFRSCIESDPVLAAGWAGYLAKALQAARFQVEVRSMLTVKARLDAWLSDGNALPRRGALQGVAFEIGVSREALYRELARRRNSYRAARAALTASTSSGFPMKPGTS